MLTEQPWGARAVCVFDEPERGHQEGDEAVLNAYLGEENVQGVEAFEPSQTRKLDFLGRHLSLPIGRHLLCYRPPGYRPSQTPDLQAFGKTVCPVLFIPDIAWFEVRAFGRCHSQRPQAFQHSSQRKL
ncbi:hypothetical protein PMKS-002458 [Pichia membranifaciens]|uniref:Uncharacterized protein n=1 Tax=Pichia membranifaciens TaxID=4926 RepID=A0A1Q2YHD1_9ASCO|nr:hypothetical protein PMKS-002458 [Pichia membranifaciens]